MERLPEPAGRGPGLASFTPFGQALGQAETEADYCAMVGGLLQLGPSALELEVWCLGASSTW